MKMSLTEFCTGSTGSSGIHRKRNIQSRTDPGFPTPGARMTVVYTNSLKLSVTTLYKANYGQGAKVTMSTLCIYK